MVSEKVFFEENNGARQATKNVANLSQDQISIFKQLFQQRMNELQEKNQLPKFEFDANVYLELNPDVKEAGVNPYQHYLEFGIKEGRRTQRDI